MQMNEITQAKLDGIAPQGAELLRGVVSADEYADYLLPLVLILSASALEREGKINLPEEARFQGLLAQRYESGNARRLESALHAIEHLPGSEGWSADWPRYERLEGGRNGDELPARLIALFETCRELSSNATARLFDDMLDTLTQEAGSRGEYYTPSTITRLMARLAKPRNGESIYDPACGSGSLLLRCAEQIKAGNPEAHGYRLFGQDINAASCHLARMNLLAHGEWDAEIRRGDSLIEPRFLDGDANLRTFDIALAAPPFSLRWDDKAAKYDSHRRFERGIPPAGKGDYAFIQHMLASLNDSGRMLVLVSHGVLFRGSTEEKIRRSLIEDGLLDAVIGLPANLLYNTPIPSAILIFKKHRENRDVLFVDAAHGFERGRGVNWLDERHIDHIVTTYEQRQDDDRYARRVSHDEVAEKSYNLNIANYINDYRETQKLNLNALERCDLELKQRLEQQWGEWRKIVENMISGK
jgi:type I restriction enzyme M protein